ncbi:hypothetical protein [Mesorhizobium sp. M1006]|uniref:hypothetical protein n=1 Tax=Mesorhizobium sp. M1006 TaxID=2957048 RepID=UPI00333502F7
MALIQQGWISGDKLRFEALNRLVDTARQSSHDFRASSELFPTLDVEKLTHTMELEKEGAERGAQNLPPKAQKTFDEVALAIVERIESEKKTAHQIVEDQMQTFHDRLTNLDFEGQFGMIRQANASSVSDFVVEATKGANDLHVLREQLQEAHRYRSKFRERHNIDRPAKISGSAYTTFKYLFLALLLLVETFLNGNFLAKGSEQGIVGGISEAFVFSLINLSLSIMASFFGLRLLVHRSVGVKLLGLVVIAAYIAGAVLLNIALAHYREVSGTLLTGATREVVQRLWTAPAGLEDLNSWMLFAFGILCSILALIDGWLLSDPYPGYTSVEKNLQRRFENYNFRKEELLEELTEIRDDHNSKVEDIIKGLSNRRKEHNAIISHRQRVISLFAEHQNQLERAANALLIAYRAANRKARTDGDPRSFVGGYNLSRVNVSVSSTGEWNDQELAASIKEAQGFLTDQIHQVDKEFLAAVRRYRELDDMFPGTTNG